MDTWDDLAEWWIAEVRDDPAYDEDVHPILVQLLRGTGGTTIDLGCGEGQGMRVVGGRVVCTDLSAPLLKRAHGTAPVVQAVLPDLSWVKDASFDRAYSVYLMDLIVDYRAFLTE